MLLISCISWFIILSYISKFHVIARKDIKIQSKQNSDLENTYALPVNHIDNVSYDESHEGKPCILYIAWGALNYSTFQVETSALSQRVSMSHVLPTTPPEICCKNTVLFQDSYTANKYFFFLQVWVLFFTRSAVRDSSWPTVSVFYSWQAEVKILFTCIICLLKFMRWLYFQ